MKKKFLKSCLQTAVISLSGISIAWSSAVFDIDKNELIINAVDVGSNVFEAPLTTQDINTFTLASASLVSDVSGAHAVYDATNLIVTLPSVKPFLSGKNAAPSYFDVTLRQVPNSDPLQFTLAGANPFTRLPIVPVVPVLLH